MTARAELEEIARDLYARPPAAFTAARDACAREALAAGDAELAAAIRRLRRPTLAAWLANVLVRERPRVVDQLLEIGPQLRSAQAALDAAALRRLSSKRRDVVEELCRSAPQLAAARGQRVGDSSIRELTETLEAASLDPGVAEQVRSGRLTSALSYSGMGFPPAPAGRSSADRRQPAGKRGRPPESRETPEAATDAKAERGGVPGDRGNAARERVRAARRAAKRAAAALSAAERAAGHERESQTAAEMELARRRAVAEKAERAVKRARADRDAAEREVRRAERLLSSEAKGAT